MERVNLSQEIASPENVASTALPSNLGSLFSDIQNLLDVPLPKPLAINEAGELNDQVEYVVAQQGLKKELTMLQHHEEARMNQLRQKTALLSLRREKTVGADGYSRSLDNANQVRTQKKDRPIGTPLEDESISDERLYSIATHDEDGDIARIASASPDFSEAFLASSRDAMTQKEEQTLLDQFGFTASSEIERPKQHSLVFEEDEIILPANLQRTLNYKNLSDSVTNRDVKGRIPASHVKSIIRKAFAVPSSRNVQRFRRKFSKSR